jgi:hypothetical protein
MGFQKYTRAEGHEPERNPGRISKFLQKLGKTSASELTDEERQQLADENAQTDE